jgi:DNA excision repair protein ERCC-2
VDTIKFPYPEVRDGQLEISRAVAAQIRDGGILVVEAPSGFGKTAAVVGGITTIAGEKAYVVYYVCRTKREIARVLEELHRFSRVSTLKFGFLVPRFELCLKRHEEPTTITPETFKSYCDFQIANRLCRYFEATFDYSEKELEEGISANAGSPLNVFNWLKEKRVCPFEALNLVAENSEVILVTYSHFFQSIVRQMAYPGISPPGSRESRRLIGVFDEAHNLPDLLSAHFNVRISYSELRAAATLASELGAQHLHDVMERASATLYEAWDRSKYSGMLSGSDFLDQLFSRISRTELFGASQQLALASERIWMGMWQRDFTIQRFSPMLRLDEVLSFLFSIDSLNVGESVMVSRVGGDADPAISAELVDPSSFFPLLTSKFHCRVFLSATLGSPSFFLERLGLKHLQSNTISVSSRALQKPVICLVDKGVTTRWSYRTPEMLERIVQRLLVFCGLLQRGVCIFASSYPILHRIVEAMRARDTRMNLYIESEGITLEEASTLIEGFKQRVGLGERALLLGVQGGRFAEGEDFGENDIQGIAVVGIGFQRPTPNLLEKMRFLKRRWANPGRILVIEPAVTRAVQSSGRGLRGRQGRLVVYLGDYRFSYPSVKQLLPKWLTDNWVQGDFTPDKLKSTLDGFRGFNGKTDNSKTESKITS